MAAMNSSVLACRYSLSGAGSSYLGSKIDSVQSVATPQKLPVIRAQKVGDNKATEGRRAALALLAGALFTNTATSSANAGIIEEYLEKSKANKVSVYLISTPPFDDFLPMDDLRNSMTRRGWSQAGRTSQRYTVEFGTCKFPENFMGCQDLAKQKKVPFITDDLQLECGEGKDIYKCGSNVFWKW